MTGGVSAACAMSVCGRWCDRLLALPTGERVALVAESRVAGEARDLVAALRPLVKVRAAARCGRRPSGQREALPQGPSLAGRSVVASQHRRSRPGIASLGDAPG